MRKEDFIKIINVNIADMSLEDLKRLVVQLANKIPNSLYETTICLTNIINGNLDNELVKMNQIKNEIYSDFKKIESGDICFRCYSYETGTYSYYDADLDYYFYLSDELEVVLNKVYNYIKKAVFFKKYSDAIEICDLLLYTDYWCEEVGNPEYDDTNEVYDTFETNIDSSKYSDLNEILQCAIYSIIVGNYANKNEKIYEYKKYGNINLKDIKEIGLEEIKNFDKFYEQWLEFLKTKNNY